MNKNKKIFLLIVFIFILFIIIISYDISRRTTFPGSKSQLKERIIKKIEVNDDGDTANMRRDTL